MKETNKQRNLSFMQCKCEICGGVDVAETALSEIILTAGYGSKLDGERVRLVLCGKCADKILSIMSF